jgi:hypothetical protein
MPKILPIVLALVPFGAADGRSGDAPDAARALLDRAIQAHGGETALAKAHRVIRKVGGDLVAAGSTVPFASELNADYPERFRLHFVAVHGPQEVRMLLVLDGTKGWQSSGGAATALSAQRVRELRDEAYVAWLGTLLPIRKEAGFGLALAPGAQVNGREAVGIKVTRKDRPDVTLHFDRETHLLVRLQRRARTAGAEVEREEVYSAHKDFDGVKLPTRIVPRAGGKKQLEITTANYRFPRVLDDSLFQRP